MDEQDVKAPEFFSTLVPPPEPGVTGMVPKDNLKKLDTIPEEEAGLTDHELKLQMEKEKYTVDIGNLSLEDSTYREMENEAYSYFD